MRSKKNFIQKSNMKKGALHSALHVPKGEKIPEQKISKALNSRSPLMRKRANFAKTLKSFSHE